MATIDELSIEVQSSAKKVDDSIEKVAGQLEVLAKAVGKVPTSTMSSIAAGLRNISREAAGFKGNKSTEIRSLSSALQTLDKVNNTSIHNVAQSMRTFAGGMKELSGVSFNPQGVLNATNALSKLGGVKAVEGTKNLKKVKNDLIDFSNGLNGIGAVNFDATGLANVISNVARLGGKSASEATKNLPSIKKDLIGFVKGLNGIGSLNFDTTGIANLTSSISKLGGKASTNAVKTIPQLSSALKNMMFALSTAPRVSQNVIQMTNALARLASQGGRVGSASNSLTKGLNNISSGSKRANKNILGLAFSFGKFYAAFALVKQGISALSGAVEYASDLTEVQNVIDVTFGNSKNVIEDFSKNAIKQFGISELAAKDTAGRFQAMGTAVGFSQDKMADMSVELTKLSADMASFYNVSQKEVSTSLQSIFTGETEPMRRYGTDLTQATLQEWALKQGIDADMQSMSQAEKVMLRYQYVIANTGAATGDFARTSASWANQVRILSEQFKVLGSVIGKGVIAAFKPFIQTLNNVMGKVISFSETVLNALGTIFGWKFEISAGGLTDDLGDSVGYTDDLASGASDASDGYKQAAKNAEKLKNVVLGIDELNINAPDDGASGTGGSSGKPSGGGLGDLGAGAGGGLNTNMFATDTVLKAYESSIDNLYKLGKYISDTMSDVLEGINWDSVYKKAENFGKGLADFLNGLINPRLFYNLGTTVANSINTAFSAANAFAINFNWENLGTSLAKSVKGFFENWDAGLTAETFSNFAKGILKSINSYIGTLRDDETFKEIGQKLVDFICGIDWAGLTFNLAEFFWAMANAMADFPMDLAKGVAEGIVAKIFGVEDVDIETPEWLDKLGTHLLTAPIPGINLLTWLPSPKELEEKLNALGKVPDWVSDWGKRILALSIPGVNLLAWLPDPKKAAEKLGEVLGKISDFKENSKKNFEDLWEKIKGVFEPVVQFFSDTFTNAYNGVKTAFSFINTWFDEKWEAIKAVFSQTVQFFSETFTNGYNAVKAAFSFINTWFQDKWNAVKNVFRDVRQFFKEKFEAGYNAVKAAFNAINTWFSDKWRMVKDVFKDVKSFFSDAFQNAYNAVTKIWDGIGGYFKGIANNIISPIGKAVNGAINGINWVLEKVGSNTRLKTWDVPRFATGANGLPQDTIGVVNDQAGSTYKELIMPPSGKPFIPEGRNVVLPMEKGTKIMPAKQTKAFMEGSGMPHFAGGIGDFLSGAWEAVKSFTGNVMDYLTKPREILKVALDKFVDISGWSGIYGDIASGAVNKVFDSAVSYIKGIFDTVVPKVDYTPSAGVEQWRQLAAHALKLTNQFTEANVNALLMQMQHESGGNPNAINNWDINAKRGTPSKGLMQVIDPTFRTWALSPYDKNIYDPLSNMIASIRYTVSRYGSLYNGWTARGYKGYASGIGKIKVADLFPRYEVGGFPEDGIFMANHDEIVGRFSNGKTAVANDYQIEKGVEEATYRGYMRAHADTRETTLLEEIRDAIREGRSISIDGREIVRAYDSRKARNGFSFT